MEFIKKNWLMLLVAGVVVYFVYDKYFKTKPETLPPAEPVVPQATDYTQGELFNEKMG